MTKPSTKFSSKRKTTPPTTTPDGDGEPLNEVTTEAVTDGASTADGAHLDGFVIPENDEASLDPDAPQQVDAEGEIVEPDDMTPARLDQAAFYTTIKTLLSVPAMYDADFAPVAVQSQEEDQARAASDAIYALLEIWYPSALQPNGDTIGHLLVAVPFIAGKVMIVRSIMSQKRQYASEEPTAPPVAAVEPQRAEPKGAIQ